MPLTRTRLAQWMREEGMTDEPEKYSEGIHGWRCSHPDIYGRCTCFDEALDRLFALVSGKDD